MDRVPLQHLDGLKKDVYGYLWTSSHDRGDGIIAWTCPDFTDWSVWATPDYDREGRMPVDVVMRDGTQYHIGIFPAPTDAADYGDAAEWFLLAARAAVILHHREY